MFDFINKVKTTEVKTKLGISWIDIVSSFILKGYHT